MNPNTLLLPHVWPRAQRVTADHCLWLAVLVHVWLLLTFGNAPGGSARPGEGVWGAVNITLRGPDPVGPVGSAPPEPPAVPTGPTGAATAARWGGAVRDRLPDPAAPDPGASQQGDWAALPAPAPTAAALPRVAGSAEAGPVLPPLRVPVPAPTPSPIPSPAPLSTPLSLPAPVAEPVPESLHESLPPPGRVLEDSLRARALNPTLPLAATGAGQGPPAGRVPLPELAAPKVQALMAARQAPPSPGAPVGALAPSSLPAPALSPLAGPLPAPAALPLAAVAPAAPALRQLSRPMQAPQPQTLPLAATAALGADPATALPRPELPALAAPRALASTVQPAPAALAPQSAAASVTPTAAASVTASSTPSSTPSAPTTATTSASVPSPLPPVANAQGGAPDAGTQRGHDVATAPSQAASAPPRLNLQLARQRGGELSRGLGSGVLAVMPRPPELESKLGEQIRKSAKADCRQAYAGAGLLAVVPLAVDAARSDSQCNW